MYYYLEHLKENGIDVLIEEKIKELKDLTDENSKIQKLKERFYNIWGGQKVRNKKA